MLGIFIIICMRKMTYLKYWRLAGVFAIIILGFPLHFLFDWTDRSAIVGLITPVNESVWEHLKLGYWSVVLISLSEYFFIKPRIHNYFLAKTIGVLALELTIVLIYYGYTRILGRDIFWIDISSYVIGAVICQYFSYIFYKQREYASWINKLSISIFIGLGILFAVTTYYPPRVSIFKDNNNNTYGIQNEK